MFRRFHCDSFKSFSANDVCYCWHINLTKYLLFLLDNASSFYHSTELIANQCSPVFMYFFHEKAAESCSKRALQTARSAAKAGEEKTHKVVSCCHRRHQSKAELRATMNHFLAFVSVALLLGSSLRVRAIDLTRLYEQHNKREGVMGTFIETLKILKMLEHLKEMVKIIKNGNFSLFLIHFCSITSVVCYNLES